MERCSRQPNFATLSGPVDKKTQMITVLDIIEGCYFMRSLIHSNEYAYSQHMYIYTLGGLGRKCYIKKDN